MRSRAALLLSLTLLVAGATIAWAANWVANAQSKTWSISYDTPKHAGTVTTKITVEYYDKLGKKNTKTITATTAINPATESTSTAKRNKVKADIDNAIAQDANKVEGDPLVTTGGLVDQTSIAPATATGDPAHFTGAKITKVESIDDKTRDTYTVSHPAGVKGMAIVTANGDIVGTAPDNTPSRFSVTTSAGSFDVSLSASMRKIELLRQVSAGLSSQGATTWIDDSTLSLFVLIDGDGEQGITSIGVGCSDIGLTSSCAVMANR